MSEFPRSKHCTHCDAVYHRTSRESNGTWSNRKYCGVACSDEAHRIRRGAEPTAELVDLPDVDRDWELRGSCREGDPDAFAPYERGESTWAEITRTARVFCERCPVLRDCALTADRWRYPGVWGGSYRGVGKPYHRTPLIVDAPMFPLPPPARWNLGTLAS